jgi:toxin-antitoxin system PIN domain toxin
VTIALPDVNVLVALAWPNHIHHEPAHAWFSEHQAAGWATCPLTESGFVRVSSNPRLTPEARRPREALQLLEKIVSLAGHVFWDDATSIVRSAHVARERLTGYRQVTDAHLVAIALAHGGRVATFDRGMRSIVPPAADPLQAVTLLGAG